MTCAYAFKHNNQIYITSDRSASDGSECVETSRPKLIEKRNGIVCTYAGSFYWGALLEFTWKIPSRKKNQTTDEYLHCQIIPSLKALLKNNAHDDEENQMLLVLDNRIFEITPSLSVIENRDQISSIGCGSPYVMLLLRVVLSMDDYTEEDILGLTDRIYKYLGKHVEGVTEAHDLVVI